MNKLHIIDQLNKLLDVDRNLTEKLVNSRYPVTSTYCAANEFLYMDDGVVQEAGMIGVLNGLLTQDEHVIAASYDDNGILIGFLLVKRPA